MPKRIGKLQEVSGCTEHELLFPIPEMELKYYKNLIQNQDIEWIALRIRYFRRLIKIITNIYHERICIHYNLDWGNNIVHNTLYQVQKQDQKLLAYFIKWCCQNTI